MLTEYYFLIQNLEEVHNWKVYSQDVNTKKNESCFDTKNILIHDLC